MPKKENRNSNIGMVIAVILIILGIILCITTGQPLTLMLSLF